MRRFALRLLVLLMLTAPVLPAFAEGTTAPLTLSAKDDYITCWKQPCVRVAGSEWSEENPHGVAISVRMGTKPVVTDDEVKQVLTRDFAEHGVTNVRFFFEQNDTPAIGIAFHVRGGTEGIFLIDNVRDSVASTAAQAKNTNPLFQ